MNRNGLFRLLILAALAMQALSVQADTSQSSVSVTSPPARQKKPTTTPTVKGMARPASADKDYAHEKLTAFVDLPDVPKYSGTGAVFLTGLRYPNDKFGQGLTMTFGVLEQAPQVYDWYKSALQQYQWSIYTSRSKDLRGSTSIDAGKGKNNINLNITPVNGKPYRTQIVLRYKFGN